MQCNAQCYLLHINLNKCLASLRDAAYLPSSLVLLPRLQMQMKCKDSNARSRKMQLIFNILRRQMSAQAARQLALQKDAGN